MIALLLSQLAFTPSAADEASFRDYRTCVLQWIQSATLGLADLQIVEAARNTCSDAKAAAHNGLTTADTELLSKGQEPAADAEVRMQLMELELTADAISELVDRRMKVTN